MKIPQALVTLYDEIVGRYHLAKHLQEEADHQQRSDYVRTQALLKTIHKAEAELAALGVATFGGKPFRGSHVATLPELDTLPPLRPSAQWPSIDAAR